MNGGPTLCRFWRAAVAANIFSRAIKRAAECQVWRNCFYVRVTTVILRGCDYSGKLLVTFQKLLCLRLKSNPKAGLRCGRRFKLHCYIIRPHKRLPHQHNFRINPRICFTWISRTVSFKWRLIHSRRSSHSFLKVGIYSTRNCIRIYTI